MMTGSFKKTGQENKVMIQGTFRLNIAAKK
jgi:hypothetical protein